jgi:hypothetical protein
MTYRVQVLDQHGHLVSRCTVDAPNQTLARRKLWRVWPADLFTIRVLEDER